MQKVVYFGKVRVTAFFCDTVILIIFITTLNRVKTELVRC